MKNLFSRRPNPGGANPSGPVAGLKGSRPLAWALTALIGCSTAALAQVPQATFTLRSRLNLTNAVVAVEVEGNTAYVSDASERLHVIDISDPSAPTIIGGVATGATIRDLFLVGNVIYAAAGTAGLQVFDVSNATQPTLIKTFDTPNEAWGVEVANNIAYLANGTTGLHIIDVTDPANPFQLGRYDSPGTARGVALRGGFAYLADLDPGIQVIDVTNPAAPVRRANYNTPDWAVGITVAGDIAYVADDTAGLVILDVKNQVPVRLGGLDTPGLLNSVQVEGKYAYVSGSSVGVAAFDVTDPTSPLSLGAYSGSGAANQFKVVDGRVFLASGSGGFEIVDTRFGLTQSLVSEHPSGSALSVGTPYPLGFVANSGLPVTVKAEGPVQLVDGVLTATNLGPVRLIIEQAGNAQYLPMRVERQFNVPGLSAMPLGVFQDMGALQKIQVVGNTAWIANGWDGVLSLSIANPASISPMGRLSTTSFVYAVSVVGQNAYLAAGDAGFVVVDAKNPAVPVRRASVGSRGRALDVHVMDGIAYVAEDEGGLSLIDVANPQVPVRLNAALIATNAVSVYATGTRAYVGQGFYGWSILDVSNPAQPALLGSVQPPASVRDIQAVGNLAYVATGSAGLMIYDVADPGQVRVVGQFMPGSAIGQVRVVGSVAYLADRDRGVIAVDVSNPGQPKALGSFLQVEGATALDVVGGRVHAITWGAQYRIFDVRFGWPQDIDWQVSPTQVIGLSGVPLVAPTTTGLPTRFSIVKGPARIVDNTLVFTGVGRVVVRAEQEGDDRFLPVSGLFTVQAELPELKVENVAGEVVVSWPAGITNVILQGLGTLDPGSLWSTATLPRSESGGEVQVRPGSSALQFFRLQGFTGDAEPLQLAGWNRDVVLENSPTRKASAVDSFGAAWFEAGLQGFNDGLPANRTIVSLLDESIRFELQPYTGSNVLALTTARRTNSLELTQPKAFSRLHILAHSAGGGGNGQLRIHFADGTVSALLPFFAPDWWDGSFGSATRNPAINNLARSATAGSFSYEFVQVGFSLHQTDVDLSTGPNAGKVISRLEFVRNLGAEVTCIFAVSGVPMPPAP